MEIYIPNVTQEKFGNQRMKDAFETCVNKISLNDMYNGSIEHHLALKIFHQKQ